MKLILLVFITLITLYSASAQLVEKKANLYVSYNNGNFFGDKTSNESGFIFPKFYSNLTKLNGYSAKVVYKIHPFLGLGLEIQNMTGSGWNLNDNDLFDGSEVTLKSLAPVFQIHTRFKESGIFNRVKLYGEVTPVFGNSRLKLEKPIFEISSGDNSRQSIDESIDNYFGIKGSAGAELSFSKDVGLFLSYSIQQSYISSALYYDENFISSQLNLGLYFRFIGNKRYAY